MNQKEEEIVKLKHVQTPNSTAVHVTTVLEFISHNSCTDYGAKLVSEDGQDVDVPLQILFLAWPGLKNLVLDGKCCCNDIWVILVPAKQKTILQVLELMFTGTISDLSSSEVASVRNFSRIAGLDWNLEVFTLFGTLPNINDDTALSDDGSDTVIIGEEFSDTDEDDEVKFGSPTENMEAETSSGMETECISQLCSRNCRSSCQVITKSWSEADLKHLKDMFKNSAKFVQIRIALMNHLVAQGNVGVGTDKYIILGHEFCIKFLSSATIISDYSPKRTGGLCVWYKNL